MGCSCKEIKGFDLAMFKARAFEQKNKKEAVVFVINNTVSFTDKSNINKVSGICCYFTTDGVEHEIKVATKVKEIEVVQERESTNDESIVEKPKKKATKKED